MSGNVIARKEHPLGNHIEFDPDQLIVIQVRGLLSSQLVVFRLPAWADDIVFLPAEIFGAGHLAGQDQRVSEMLEVNLNGSLQATFPAVTEDGVNASKLLVRVRRAGHVPRRVFRVSPDRQAAAKVPEMFLA